MTEENFLRDKTKVVYENSTTTMDSTTGEILYQTQTETKKVSSEPEYIKIYYKAMMAVNDIAEIPLEFLLALSSQIGYTNGEQVLFFNNKTTREIISKFCGIGDNMTQKYLKRCVEKGILFTTKDRGTYEVNPWLIARGRWENIRKLQTNFCFTDGRWERIIVENENEEP